MKTVIVFAAIVTLALALPYEVDIFGADRYQSAFETSDGESRQKQAVLKKLVDDFEVKVVRGSYTFVGADGQVYTTNYVADEKGFKPDGENLPIFK